MDILKQENVCDSKSYKETDVTKKNRNRKKNVTRQTQRENSINDLIIFSTESSQEENDEPLRAKHSNENHFLTQEAPKIFPIDPVNTETTILYKNENIEKLLERNCLKDLPVFLGAMNLEDNDSDNCPDDKTFIRAKKKPVKKGKHKKVIENQIILSSEVTIDPNKSENLNKINRKKNSKKTSNVNTSHVLDKHSIVDYRNCMVSRKILKKYTESCNNKILTSTAQNSSCSQQDVSNNMSTVDKLQMSMKNVNRQIASNYGYLNTSANKQLKKTESKVRRPKPKKVFNNSVSYGDITSDSSLESEDSEEIENIRYSEQEKNIQKTRSTSVSHDRKNINENLDILAIQKQYFQSIKNKSKTVGAKPYPEPSQNSSQSRKAERKLAFFERKARMVENKNVPNSNLNEHYKTANYEKKTLNSPRRPQKKASKNAQALKKEVIIEFFEDYVSEKEVAEGLESKIMLEGYLRINSKNSLFAYVTHPDPTMKDIEVDGVKNRNRALDGDFVVIQLLDSGVSERQKGKVVFIKEYNHPRVCVGNLKLNLENEQPYFIPRDKRMPLMFIPLTECPPSFNSKLTKLADDLFLVKIVSWAHTAFITGTIVQKIGSGKLLNNQNRSIMLENRLDAEPYGDDIKKYLPEDNFVIPEKEFLYREDFRNECVFTIDPPSARDLDDAVSCKILDNGNYEIGVHISDVTYYLHEGTPLDDQVAKKATTVYLVDETYHMLPKQLCLHCSLLPNCDKLVFSVIWEMAKDGTIIAHRFTRGIMNSCCQLSYDHVTRILESEDMDLTEEKFPQIKKPWTLSQVCEIVRRLHEVAVIFRKKRYDNGALRINQTKLSFLLDPVNRDPVAFYSEEHTESHQLIEEFMLLANITVAARIYDDFPNLAFLRAHRPPKDKIHSVIDLFQSLGISIDATSAGNLQTSLAKVTANDDSGMKSLVLDAHLIKTQSRAMYFCSDGCDDDDSQHYALNIPIYTHFTSPIRRYADVVVHRLLSASLHYSTKPTWTPEYVRNTAKKCNEKKYSAKNASDSSSEVYLMKYILNKCPMVETAVVMDIYENSLEVIIISMGLTRRIYFDNFSVGIKPKPIINFIKKNNEPNKLSVMWPAGKNYKKTIIQTIEIFSVVSVLLNRSKNILSISSNIQRPKEE